MVSAANGYATVKDLQAVATRDNLSRVENQLVVVADSRDAGNKELQRLFAANGWQQTDSSAASAPAGQPSGRGTPAVLRTGGAGLRPGEAVPGGGAAASPAARPAATARLPDQKAKEDQAKAEMAKQSDNSLPAPGVYYLARQNGEDAWVVLTDRENLARFNGQLARNGRVTVAGESLGEFEGLVQAQVAAKLDAARDAAAAAEAQKRAAEENRIAQKATTEFMAPPISTLPEKTEGEIGYKVAQPIGKTADKEAVSPGVRKASGAAATSGAGDAYGGVLQSAPTTAARGSGDRPATTGIGAVAAGASRAGFPEGDSRLQAEKVGRGVGAENWVLAVIRVRAAGADASGRISADLAAPPAAAEKK